jgi:nitrogenase molybdenum-iron protein NifN
MSLAEISEQPVPPRIERQRSQLQDAMLDTHFMLGQLRVAIAADPDQLNAFAHLVHGMGGEVVAAVSAANAPLLSIIPVASVKIGDLEDLESLAREGNAQLLIGNSHAACSAERLGIPILRAGFPLYDIIGGYQKTWIGYRGSRQALFDLANLVINFAHEEIEVYRSPYAQKPESERHACPPSCH